MSIERGFFIFVVIKAYISISFNKRKMFEPIVKTIHKTLAIHHITPFVFDDHYTFSSTQEKEMMQTAINDIKSSQILIAETSDKGIGIGIEVGYAKALNIPIIYIRNISSEHSTTVSSISDFEIIYNDESDLEKQLNEVIKRIKVFRNYMTG